MPDLAFNLTGDPSLLSPTAGDTPSAAALPTAHRRSGQCVIAGQPLGIIGSDPMDDQGVLPMTEPLSVLAAAIAPGSSREQRAAAADVCRMLIAALEAQEGQPLPISLSLIHI